MALPAGSLKATVTAGGSTDVAGVVGTISDLTVAPEYRLVWAATGDPVETIRAEGTAGSIEILADQAGVLASSTVDGEAVMVEVRGWPMVARWTVTVGSEVRRHVRRFAAPASGTTVDLDMLPQSGAAVPGTVTMAQTINIGTGSDEEIAAAVEAYLLANPPEMGALTDLTDVTVGDSTPGDVLMVDEAGVWRPATIPAPDMSGYVETTDARLSDARTPTAHAASHKTAGADALTAADIGAQPAGSYAAASHTQAASTISDSTAVGRSMLTAADAAAARTAIGAGTSNLAIGTGATDAKAGNYTPPDATTTSKGVVQLAGDLAGTAAAPTVVAASETVAGKVELATTAEAQAGTDTTRAVTPAGLKAVADTRVLTSRTVNGKALTGNITLTAADVGAAPASGQATVNALTAAASVTVPATHSMHTLTMATNTTLAFANPTAGHAFTLKLSGAFTPTFPASVTWAGGSAPTYASGKVYVFATFDAGTSWIGGAL